MILAVFLLAAAADAQSPRRKVGALLEGATQPGIMQTAIGVTRKGTPIPALITAADLDYNTPKTRILLVAGLDGSSASVSSALSAIEWFHRDPAAANYRDQIALSAVPVANPDGWVLGLGPGNGSGGNPARGYAPRGDAYHSPTEPEAAYLWRWIGMSAPDLVIDIHRGATRGWGYMPPEWIDPGLPFPSLTAHLPPPAVTRSWADQLASQLVRGRPSRTGAVSALTFYTPKDDGSQFLEEILQAITKANFRQPSSSRQTIQRRLARTPLEVARQLASHYGHDASSIVYTRTVAILGRIRLAELTGDRDHLEDIERLLAPYASGEKPSLPARGCPIVRRK